jgi:hypothetical protein
MNSTANNSVEHQDRHDCSICGRPATATWRGVEFISVCPKCATEHLPRLIADAIHLSGNASTGQAMWAYGQIKLKFWRALALRLALEKGGAL